MKYICVLFSCLLVASCATGTSTVISTKLEVVIPPSSFLRCGDINLPEKFSSNKDVARSYVKLWKHDHQCKYNMDSIKKYLDDAQKSNIIKN